jgi:hypothetical protein
VITDFGAESAVGVTAVSEPPPGRSPSASACAPYRDTIELGLSLPFNSQRSLLISTSYCPPSFFTQERQLGILRLDCA